MGMIPEDIVTHHQFVMVTKEIQNPPATVMNCEIMVFMPDEIRSLGHQNTNRVAPLLELALRAVYRAQSQQGKAQLTN
jgi:hypothetical protein